MRARGGAPLTCAPPPKPPPTRPAQECLGKSNRQWSACQQGGLGGLRGRDAGGGVGVPPHGRAHRTAPAPPTDPFSNAEVKALRACVAKKLQEGGVAEPPPAPDARR